MQKANKKRDGLKEYSNENLQFFVCLYPVTMPYRFQGVNLKKDADVKRSKVTASLEKGMVTQKA